MRRYLVLALVAAACTGPAASTTTTTTAPPPTVSTAPGGGTLDTTTTSTTIQQGPSGGSLSSTTTTNPVNACPQVDVVLVESNDVLNVRTAPNPNAQIVFTLPYNATGVYRTSTLPAFYNGSEWWEIHEPLGQNVGWANSFYLTCQQAGFASDPQPSQVLSGLALHASGSSAAPPWSSVVSPYGLTVEHFDATTPPKYWPANQNPFTDGTVYQWSTEAGGPNSVQDTFYNQVGTLWLDNVLNDTQYQVPTGPVADQVQQGQEAAPPWTPAIFTNLHYLSVFDPGDDPNVGGLDWRTVYAYFDWTPGNGWRLRGLSFDSWAP